MRDRARPSNRLKQSRALATRCAERAAHYRSSALLAATALWLS